MNRSLAKESAAKNDISASRSSKSTNSAKYLPKNHLKVLTSVTGSAHSPDTIATRLSRLPPANRAPELRALQRTYGNRSVQHMSAGIQAKLRVGQPGDIYEQEADRVADEVMRMPEQGVQRQVEPDEEEEEELVQPKLVADAEYSIQRQVEEEELIQTKPIAGPITSLIQRQEENEEEEEERIQPKTASGRTPEVTPDVRAQINTMKGGGQPLPIAIRAYFEPRLGHNFSQVRVHADDRATEMAQALNARAFTVGSNLVFGTGQYQPDTPMGKRLIAHELTHVIQQCGLGWQKSDVQMKREPPRQTKRKPAPAISNWEQGKNLVPKDKAAHWYTPWIREVTLRKDRSTFYINFPSVLGRKWCSNWGGNVLNDAVTAMTSAVVTAVIARRLPLEKLRKYWQIPTGIGGVAGGARTYIGLKAEERLCGSIFLGHRWYGRYRRNIITGKLVAVDFLGKDKDREWLIGPFIFRQRMVDRSGKVIYTHWPNKLTAGPDYSMNLPTRSFGKFD